jgi:hypothetical protein
LKKNLNPPIKDQIKTLIIQTITKEKPETQKKLITLMQERNNILPELTNSLLIELENEDLLRFAKQKSTTPASKERLFSTKAIWYWIVISLAIATAITMFIIPDTVYPLVYLRSTLGIIFVLFLPGFTFIKALFPVNISFKHSSKKLDTIERTTLSLGMSLCLVTLVGLILNYTPWGIRLTSITFSLLALTIVFATAAVLREYQAKAQELLKSANSL